MPYLPVTTDEHDTDHDDANASKQVFYRMRDWDPKTGWPSHEKLAELGFGWLQETGRGKHAIRGTEEGASR